MLSSSVCTLVARVTVQTWALKAPNGLAYAPKRVRAHFDRACFVTRALSPGHRQGNPSNRPVSDPSMAHLP